MKVCSQCQTSLPFEAEFCTNCGLNLKNGYRLYIPKPPQIFKKSNFNIWRFIVLVIVAVFFLGVYKLDRAQKQAFTADVPEPTKTVELPPKKTYREPEIGMSFTDFRQLCPFGTTDAREYESARGKTYIFTYAYSDASRVNQCYGSFTFDRDGLSFISR